MKIAGRKILFFVALLTGLTCSLKAQEQHFEFYDETFFFHTDSTVHVDFSDSLCVVTVKKFYEEMNTSNYDSLIQSLTRFKKEKQLNDWLYYQLIRKTAQTLSAKSANYARYTLYKWFLMAKSGYDARLAVGHGQIIFFIRNTEDITDIPFFEIGNKKYTCLNYHDYGKLFKRVDSYIPVEINIEQAKNDFSYKVTRIPDFKPQNYKEKKLDFRYGQRHYHFKIKLSTDVFDIFANYPGVDFESYFNIPLSRETYESLIPVLKENTKKMSTTKGVDYLMRFTRYAFLYEDDEKNFGKEKRMSPEQTLLNPFSDCDDRAALFFYLVKEIYNLPMITLLYPTHITMAVQFDKPIGDAILFNGKYYSICEPTPQAENLSVGQLADNLKNTSYQVVYHYDPN